MTGDLLALQPHYVRNMVDLHGEADGRAFLDRLPGIVRDCAERWGLRLDPPFPRLTYNWAAPGVDRDGRPVVLKVAYSEPGRPEIDELHDEREALRLFGGHGAVALLASDPARGAMLIERAVPGHTLRAVEDDAQATTIVATLLRRLWRPLPPDHPFPSLDDWFCGFARHRARYGGGPGPLPSALFDRAEAAFRDLLAEPAEHVLLHGDLHHDNILSGSRRAWLAIDPKGVVGPREFDVVAFTENPRPDLLDLPSPGDVLRRRLYQFADELGFDAERLREWAIAQAVLSAVWSVEDHGAGGDFAIECARLLAEGGRWPVDHHP